MKYEIVKYNPEFKSQILELQTHLWSPDKSLNAAYLEWKYEHNPYMDKPLISLALYEGRVVGMRGVYGAKWQIGHPSQTFLAPCAGDSVVDPTHRRRGLFAKTSMAALNCLSNLGYMYTFNLSGGRFTVPGYLKMNWHSAGVLQVMHWGVISPDTPKYINERFFFSTDDRQHPFFHLDHSASKHKIEVGPHVCVEQTPRPKAMAELVRRIGGDGGLRHVIDQQYFSWRFRNPLSVYRFFFWEDSGLEGYLILQTPIYTDRNRVNIVDWEATTMRVRSELLYAAITFGNFECITIWSTSLSDANKILLQNSGFKVLEKPASITNVLVRPVCDTMLKNDWVFAQRRLLDLDNWDLRMIYSDNY